MKISPTKLFKPLSVHEPTHQMQTYCEREKKSRDGTFNNTTWSQLCNLSIFLGDPAYPGGALQAML